MAAASVEEAFAYCEARAKAHYENFPVGLFVPREKRPYVHALYAFARAADDFADEPVYEGVRKEKLDQWEALTHAAYRGEARGRSSSPSPRRCAGSASRRSCCWTSSPPSARTP
jgi:phytoene/squalene synthetase